VSVPGDAERAETRGGVAGEDRNLHEREARQTRLEMTDKLAGVAECAAEHRSPRIAYGVS